MKIQLVSILALIAALIVACNSSEKKEANNTGAPIDSAAAQLNEFIANAHQGCVSSIELASIANKSNSLEIRNFGEKVARENKLLLDSISEIASDKSIPLPDSAAAVAAELVEKLSSKSGADFDRALVRAFSSEQRRISAGFRKARKSEDAQIRNFIRNNSATLRSQTEALQEIKQSLKSTDTESRERNEKPA